MTAGVEYGAESGQWPRRQYIVSARFVEADPAMTPPFVEDMAVFLGDGIEY